MAQSTRFVVETSEAASAVGPYSQAVCIDSKTLYISGTMGIHPQTNQLVSGGVEAQTRQALTNIEAILRAAQGTLKNVVKVTVLMTDLGEFSTMNEVYKEFFTSMHPARAAYQVVALPKGSEVEIEAIAILGEIEDYEIA